MDKKKSATITIKDIAKALDLAPSSVARALKGSHKISEATIQRVREYAKAHNYRPNLMAQSLKRKQSRSIGVLLCSIPNNFFAEVLNGIESIATEKEYHVMISQSHESYEKEVRELENFQWKAVDGLLVSLSAETKDISHFETLIDNGIPVVFFDRVPEEVKAPRVMADDEGGSFQLIKHLLDQGFQRIAHITSSPQLSLTHRRLDGYKRALSESGIDLNDDYIKYCLHGGRDETEIIKAVEELLSLKNPPDAITTASDRITIKTLAVLRGRGIKVPQKVALGGFSNFSSPELFNPSLTTVVQPAFEIGRTAIELLLKLIETKRPVREFPTVVLSTDMKILDSSKRMAK
ncbi:MAG: LacI family DNA-binding transcriptional regulator [Flavisolibacter sp.]